MLTVLDGSFPAAPLRWTRRLLGWAALFTAWDAWFALHEAAEGVPIRTFRSLPRLDGGAIVVVSALFVAGGLALLTARAPRAGAVLVAVTAATTIVLEQQSYSNHWVLLITTTSLFALVPRPTGGVVPYWPVFLLRTQITSVYLFTGIAKVNGSYFTGRPLKWGTIELIGGRLPEKVFVVISIALLLVELFLAVALWVPRWRGIAVPLGIAMHLSIIVTGAGPVELIPFQLAALSTYPLFAREPSALSDRSATAPAASP